MAKFSTPMRAATHIDTDERWALPVEGAIPEGIGAQLTTDGPLSPGTEVANVRPHPDQEGVCLGEIDVPVGLGSAAVTFRFFCATIGG